MSNPWRLIFGIFLLLMIGLIIYADIIIPGLPYAVTSIVPLVLFLAFYSIWKS